MFQDLQRHHRWVGLWLQPWDAAKPGNQKRVRSITTLFSTTITCELHQQKTQGKGHLSFSCEQVRQGSWPPVIFHLKWFPDYLHSSSWGVWSRRPGKGWSYSSSHNDTDPPYRCLLEIQCFYNVIYWFLPLSGAIKEQHQVFFRHEGP